MSNGVIKKFNISIVIPIFNGEYHIQNCIKSITNQDFKESFEIIFIDDGSTDKSVRIIEKYKIPNLKIFSLNINSGQSAARNLGIKKAMGQYIFFMDVDDTIEINTLSTLFKEAITGDYDFVCSDFKRMENSQNQREGKYNYSENKEFLEENIISAMRDELYDPTLGHLGLFGCNGRLIRRSIIVENDIKFEEKLRWLEDKTFCWDILSHVKTAKYVRKQLYSYFVYPSVKTAITESLSLGFSLSNIKIIVEHVKKALEIRKIPSEKVRMLCQQALIFFSIQLLVSISRSIVLGKIDKTRGKYIRKKIIKEILSDEEVAVAIKKYKPSNKESRWIPKAIFFNSLFLVELACIKRAKDVVSFRRNGKM